MPIGACLDLFSVWLLMPDLSQVRTTMRSLTFGFGIAAVYNFCPPDGTHLLTPYGGQGARCDF